MLKGKVHKYEADVNTDVIIPARYLNLVEPGDLAAHCMEDIDKEFLAKVKPGDIMVATTNFGCGSSREHAPIALKAAGIAAVIAPTFARIFYRNAFNMGLPIFELKESAEIAEGDEISVDMNNGTIITKTSGRVYSFLPIHSFMQDLIDAGGLMNYAQNEIKGK